MARVMRDGGGRVVILPDCNTILHSFGVTSLDDGLHRTSEDGYLATVDEENFIAGDVMDIDFHHDDDDGGGGDDNESRNQQTVQYSTLGYNDMRRRLILNEIKEFSM